MVAFNCSIRTATDDAAITYEVGSPASPHHNPGRPYLRLAALVFGGVMSLQFIMLTAASAQTDPPILAAPGAAAAIADRKSLSSEKIISNSLAGKAIIIVGGKGRTDPKVMRDPIGVGALNPQPLPPVSLNPQPLPPVGSYQKSK